MPKSAFRQVSLPAALMDEVSAAAKASDRSVAKELEHAFKVARAIEKILPPASVKSLKEGLIVPSKVLELLLSTTVLVKGGKTKISSRPRIARDPDDHSKRILFKEDGAKEHGTLDEQGNFIPERQT